MIRLARPVDVRGASSYVTRGLSYSYTKRLRCPAKQIHDIVLNVKDYKQFVPYVIESGHKYDYTGDQTGHGPGFFKLKFQTFTENVDCVLDFNPQVITSKCYTGQFKHLECKWTFEDITNKLTKRQECNVTIELDYEFHSMIYNQLSQWFTGEISRLMVKSFEKRLKQLNK